VITNYTKRPAVIEQKLFALRARNNHTAVLANQVELFAIEFEMNNANVNAHANVTRTVDQLESQQKCPLNSVGRVFDS
jgi:hypothetical protein